MSRAVGIWSPFLVVVLTLSGLRRRRISCPRTTVIPEADTTACRWLKGEGIMRRAAAVVSLIAISLATSGCGGSLSSMPSPPPSPSASSIKVQVAPNSATVLRGATQHFTATVTGTSNTVVIWSVQEKQLGFDAGTIDNTGLYTAPQDAEGTFHVVATSQAASTAMGTAAVNVPVPAVSISPAVATLVPGGTQTFTSTVTGMPDAGVAWTVEEAARGVITNTGSYTAPLLSGFFHVVATSLADATASANATITVTTSTAKFTPTGDLQGARGFHTATLLSSGKVLTAGGANRAGPICTTGIPSTELYDPDTGTFASSNAMTSDRYMHTATLLPSGEVLVTGGFGSGHDCEDLGGPAPQTSAELFDPSTGSFKATGSMLFGRAGHTATLLPNGKVLIVGGSDQGTDGSAGGIALSTAELYDPATGVFASTGSMITARLGHTATLLSNGKVLITGGDTSEGATASAEIYDPATGAFSPTGSMASARTLHTSTLLTNGNVLIAGGPDLATAELYDPSKGSFSLTGQMGIARSAHTATLLSNGLVLIAGGGSPTAELYDPSAGLFTPTGSMETERTGHSATLLQNGTLLVAGGGSRAPLASAELYK